MAEFSKYGYSGVNFKRKVAVRFRVFSKNISMSNTETLTAMMDFFEFNGIDPTDNLGDSIAKLEVKINKRTNAIIAIIKDIEKNQTKPTNAMLLSLFEAKLEDEEPEFIERKFADNSKEEKTMIETTVPKIRYERLEDKLNLVKEDFEYVLDKVKVVKSSFGKDYLRLELTKNELLKFKRMLLKM